MLPVRAAFKVKITDPSAAGTSQTASCPFLFFSSVPIEIAVQRLIAPTQSPSLLAIPFFILLGTLMSYTGIAERILHIANVLVGKMRAKMK